MTRKNYKDDFDFIMKLRSCNGEDIGFPSYDWRARLYTDRNKANFYAVSCIGGVCENCFNDNGQVHVVVNSHNMGPGKLMVEFTSLLPNDIYPDSDERIVLPEPIDIELVAGKGDCPHEIEVELVLPFIKGEPFRFEDFTEEQLRGIVEGASKAAIEKVDGEIVKLDDAEALRVEAERRRVVAEESRVKAELGRESAETQRTKAEQARESNEIERIKDETTRQSNESVRTANETARVKAEDKRTEEFEAMKREFEQLKQQLAEMMEQKYILME